jgi:transcriptional regulator with XRE-family HTH domain
MSWADRLKDARNFYGMSQEDMAARLEVSYRTYQGYEQGASEPKAAVLERLVSLGFSGQWLLTGQGEMRGESTAPAPASKVVDEDLNGLLIEAVAAAYAAAGIKAGPREWGRVAAEIYNDIASVATSRDVWEEAIQIAALQLRRRLQTANHGRDDAAHGKHSA